MLKYLIHFQFNIILSAQLIDHANHRQKLLVELAVQDAPSMVWNNQMYITQQIPKNQ
jgi:hypothetical protein